MRYRSLKKKKKFKVAARTPFTLYDQTKTGIDKRKRQHKIGIYFTDVCYDLDI